MIMQSPPIRVLLVDDDEHDLIVVRDLLSDLSSIECMLEWVSDYRTALEAILSSEFDVCLLNYRIKERNGLEFLQEAVSRGAETPVVFLTGRGGCDPDLEAMSNGAACSLTKGELSATLLERSIRYSMGRQRKSFELIRAKRVIQALSECNDAVIHIIDEVELLRAICRIVVDVGGYKMAWVGYAEDDPAQTVTPVAGYGYVMEYLATVNVTWQDAERGKGPVGTCIRTGLPSIIRSVGSQAEFEPWKAEASKRGYASVIGLPLFLDGRRLGALTIYSTETDAFDTAEVEFLVKLSSNLSYGIGVLRLRKAQVQAEELLKDANLDLERRVEERTAELARVNAELRTEIVERRQAEEAVRESQEYLYKIVNSISDPIFVKDKDHRLILVNDAACMLAGLKREEILGKTGYEFFPKKEVDIFWKEDESVFESGEEDINEEEIRDGEGVFHTIVTKKTLVTDKAGNQFIVGIIRDITAHKEAELALQASQQQFQDIINFLPDATFVIDRQKKVIAWNRAIEEMTGVKQQEIIGKGDYAYAVPFYGEKRPILIDFVAADKKEAQGKYDVIEGKERTVCGEVFVPETFEGRGAYLWATASQLFDHNGNIIGAIESIRDISDRKQAEETVKQSEERYRQLFETVPDAILVFDGETCKFIDVNDRALQLYGYSRDEFLELKYGDITAEPDQSDAFIKKTLIGILTHVPLRYHRKKKGKEFPAEISSTTFLMAGRKVLCSLVRDITTRKRVEEELNARTRRLEEFNAALKVLLKQREEDKTELEESVLINVKSMVSPYVEKLKKSRLGGDQVTYLTILESHIQEIISPFTKRLSEKYLGLTPTEVQAAALIKEGKTTQEIAELLCISENTVSAHRFHIRKKLGVANKKVNLRYYLQSFEK